MNKKTDRRSVKTRNAIRKAFSILLQEKALQDITVKELTDLADVHRATFYSHYTDIYDLYHDFENEILVNLSSIFDDPSLLTYKSFYNVLLDYVDKNPDIVKTLILSTDNTSHSPLLHNLLEYMVEACKKSWLEDYHLTEITPDLEYFAYYRIHGIIAMIRRWISTDYSMPLDKLKRLIAELDSNVESFMFKSN